MPIYAYRCQDCGHQKDHLQKLSDAPIAACPACGGAQYAKQLTAAGFQLKGNGWYATDFKGGSGGSSTAVAPSTTADSASPASDSSTKTEASAPATACGGGCACH